MYCVADAKQTLELENQAVVEQNLAIEQLMDSAGKSLADEVIDVIARKFKADTKFQLAVMVCGKGNNAGDAFVAARYLDQANCNVKVIALYGAQNLSPDAKQAFNQLPSHLIAKSDEVESLLNKAEVIVDAIFGFSYRPPVRDFERQFIQQVNKQKAYVISADVPSGLEATSGAAVEGEVVKADKTLCFTTIKKGLLTDRGPLYAGKIKVAEIGIDPQITRRFKLAQSLNLSQAAKLLPKKSPLVNKKSVGRVLVIGNSSAYVGAAIMSAHATLRTGAGFVVLAVPENIKDLVQQKAPAEVIVRGLPDTRQGTVSVHAVEEVFQLSQGFDCLVIGPGLTTNEETLRFVVELLQRINKPTVVDADGLNALSQYSGSGGWKSLLEKVQADLILTPHSGELSRLTGLSVQEIEKDRFGAAENLVSEKVSVLLKGRYSIIAARDETYVNLTSNPAMATAGTGDVLSGIVAAFVAQDLELVKAAALGAYIHGLAGDIAAQELTQYSLIATDLINYLPKAFKRVEGEG